LFVDEYWSNAQYCLRLRVSDKCGQCRVVS